MNQQNRELKGSELKISRWSPDDFLDTPEAAVAYLEAAFEDGDPKLIIAALGDVAKANGMTNLASATGLSRESLYKALSQKGNPRFVTVLNVLRALDIGLRPIATVSEQADSHEFAKS